MPVKEVNRSYFLPIRLSIEEKERLQARADRKGMKLSTYVRMLILEDFERALTQDRTN